MPRTLVRRAAVTAIAAVAMALGTTTAFADDVYNTLDNTIDSVVEVMPLTFPGDTGTTSFRVHPQKGDGESGCNLKNSGSLTVAVVSSDPSVASVSPSSLTFSDCDKDVLPLEVTPLAAGSSTITLQIMQNNTSGSFNLAPATFRVDVAAAQATNTAPTVTVTGVELGASYEIGSVPAAGCSAVDQEDGNSTFAAQLSAVTGPLAQYGLGEQTATCGYTDAAGLTAVSSVTYSIVDTTAPTITYIGRTPAANAAGWNNGDVSLTWACSDNVAIDDAASTTTATVSTEGADQSATGTCTDVSGNTVSDTQSGINIDKTAPGVEWIGGPASGGSYYFGSVPAAPTCTAIDVLSGAKDCAVTGYGTAVGNHTLTATAHDVADNTGTDTRDYSVLAWTLKGFYQPVDMGGVLNTVKGGSTVPLKFEIFAGDTEITDVGAIDRFTVSPISCSTASATTDDIELTTTGGTTLRYDATGSQFIQNWQTPKSPGSCFKVTMKTDDGSSISANFKLK